MRDMTKKFFLEYIIIFFVVSVLAFGILVASFFVRQNGKAFVDDCFGSMLSQMQPSQLIVDYEKPLRGLPVYMQFGAPLKQKNGKLWGYAILASIRLPTGTTTLALCLDVSGAIAGAQLLMPCDLPGISDSIRKVLMNDAERMPLAPSMATKYKKSTVDSSLSGDAGIRILIEDLVKKTSDYVQTRKGG